MTTISVKAVINKLCSILPRVSINTTDDGTTKDETIPLEVKHEVIDEKYYFLFIGLPDSIFKDDDYLDKIIWAFRNSHYHPKEIQYATVRKLLIERTARVSEDELMQKFNSKMTSEQKVYKLAGMERMVKRFYNKCYRHWASTWKEDALSSNITEPGVSSMINHYVFKKGACEKFTNIKAVDQRITCRKLLLINSQFMSIRKAICKSCLNHHRVGCCDEYTSTNRSSAIYINNIKIVHET